LKEELPSELELLHGQDLRELEKIEAVLDKRQETNTVPGSDDQE